MAHWTRLCVAVDFSEPSRSALEDAAALARRLEAELTVVHVHQAPDIASTTPDLATMERLELERQLEAWRSAAERIAERPVRARLLMGHPAAEIIRFTDEESMELVVLATRGRTGFKRFVLGSVAERVVREAACPVLVGRAR